MIIEEFLQYINNYITIEELFLAGLGLIFMIIIFILGGKEQKENEKTN